MGQKQEWRGHCSFESTKSKLSLKLELLQAEKRLILKGILPVKATKRLLMCVLALVRLATPQPGKFREYGSQWNAVVTSVRSPVCTLREIKQTSTKADETRKMRKSERQVFDHTV
jgi:hypothetical protein